MTTIVRCLCKTSNFAVIIKRLKKVLQNESRVDKLGREVILNKNQVVRIHEVQHEAKISIFIETLLPRNSQM